MRTMSRRIYRKLWLAAVCILPAAMAGAQNVSAPLSTPLDSTASSVAPTTSTEIVQGAGNLMVTVTRTPPMDATGANIFSTAMNPFARSDATSQTPSQLDGALKDSILMTSIGSQGAPGAASSHRSQQLPGVASASMTSSFSARSASSSAAAKRTGTDNLSTGDNAQGSSWRPASRSISVHADIAPGAGQGTEAAKPFSIAGEQSSRKTGTTGKTAQDGKTQAKSRTQPLQAGQQQDARGTSSETSHFSWDHQQAEMERSTGDATPFKDLDNSSYLNTNIFAPATSAQPLSSGTKSYYSRRPESRKRGTAAASRLSALNETGMQRQAIELRRAERSRRQPKPKWHNPILEQMDINNSQDQP